jgi:membrane dipeptidase
VTGAALRDDPAGWAGRLSVSREAVDLVLAADTVDIHVESFVWTRVFGYDLGVRHGRNALGTRWFGQVDVPRLRAAGLSGAVMSIATNPFRTRASRRATLLANLARLRESLVDAGVAVVSGAAGYRRARQAGDVACFLAVQGGNALGPDDLGDAALDVVSRITLVHLTRSALGSASAPGVGGGGGGLTGEGRRFVEAMRERSIILDLAHAAPATFWDALDVHGRDPQRPVVVSHTGVRAARESWRNLDDDQIRAVADRGGVIGVMLHRGFLARPSWRATAADVVRHLEHVVAVGGEASGALGSDFDGLIVPPRDVPTVLELPRIVQAMLDHGFGPELVGKVLGANYLRVVETVRSDV